MNETVIPQSGSLKVDKYTINLDASGCSVYRQESTFGKPEFICKCVDPVTAQEIVEGLILVQMKRFYYPDSKPEIKNEAPTFVNPQPSKNKIPPFLTLSNT